MKIAIIGYSGSGKSTLAGYLAARYQLDVLYLDRVHWLPGWVEQDRETEIAQVSRFLDSHTNWVIDGNYSALSFQRRLEEADRILILNFNRFSCLFRALRRLAAYRGKTRESMTAGCPEKVDAAFVRWILYQGRTARHRNRFRQILAQYPEKTMMLKNQRQLTAYRARLEAGGSI